MGKAASMVLLRANPLDDIRNAQQIEGVVLRGEYFGRAELDGPGRGAGAGAAGDAVKV